MKKLRNTIIALLLSLYPLSSCAQHPSDVEFKIAYDESFSELFYPSLAIWNAVQEDPSDLFYGFELNAPAAGDVIRITVEETKLNEKTIIQRTAEEPGLMYLYDIIIKWKYDVLNKLAQGGTQTMTCILEINGKEIDRINYVVKYRPVNECVYAIYDSESEEYMDASQMFALYVNEDFPQIDNILGEILSKHRDRQFVDYQGNFQDFINQVFWVWEHFSLKGTRYSNVVNTSNQSETVGMQYVRFIDQVINNVQANCVDGSALLASIFTKMGLDCYLVMLPGHMQLAVYCPYAVEGYTGEDGGLLFIETTLMGANASPQESFDAAIELVDLAKVEERWNNEEGFDLINIKEARSSGIMPIPRTMRGAGNTAQ